MTIKLCGILIITKILYFIFKILFYIRMITDYDRILFGVFQCICKPNLEK